MDDLTKALRESMRQQIKIASSFTAQWKAATAWQHKKGQSNG